MRRLILALSLVAVVATVLATSALPAFATGPALEDIVDPEWNFDGGGERIMLDDGIWGEPEQNLDEIIYHEDPGTYYGKWDSKKPKKRDLPVCPGFPEAAQYLYDQGLCRLPVDGEPIPV